MNIRLFGLTLDGSGVIKTMKEVTDASVNMAQAGAKNAQLYADAFQEKLNRVARQYIPETMRAIDALRERQQSLGQSTQLVASQTMITAEEFRRAEAAYAAARVGFDGVSAAEKAVAESSGLAFTGLGRIRQGLTSLIASVTGTMPVLDRIISSFGSMAVGSGVMVGALAGIAAAALAYHALTRDARDAEAAQDAALKKLVEWDRQRHLGGAGQLGADVENASGALGSQIERQRIIAGIGMAGPAGAGVASLLSVFFTDTKKQFAAGVQAVSDGRQALGAETTKLMLDQREKQATMLADAITNGNATHAQRQQALRMLREDTALAAQYAKAGLLDSQVAVGDQAKTLHDALYPKKEERDEERLRREIADVLRTSDEARQSHAAAQAVRSSDGLAGLVEELDASERLLAAERESTGARKEATAEERAYQMVEKAGIMLDDARFAGALKMAQGIVANTDATKDLIAANEKLDAAIRKAEAEAERDAKRRADDISRFMKQSFTTFFTDVFERGKNIFQSLWDVIKQGFVRMIADIVATDFTARMAGLVGGLLIPGRASGMGDGRGHGGIADASVGGGMSTGAGYGAIGIGSFGLGYGIGSSSGGNRGASALGGAAAGAATGALIGSVVPGIGTAIGALVGATVGLIGGLFGASSAAKDAETNMRNLQAALKISMAALQATVSHDTLGAAIAQVNAEREQLRRSIEDAYAGGKNEAQRVIVLRQMNALEDQRVQQLKEEYSQTQKNFADDLKVRSLVATGHTREADALRLQLAQQREMQDALKNNVDPATIALLAQVQAQEKLAAATQSATTAGLNMVAGYRTQAMIFNAMAPQTSALSGSAGPGGSWPTSIAPPTGRDTNPSIPTNQPIILTLDGEVVAKGVVRIGARKAAAKGFTGAEWYRGLTPQ